MRDGGHDPYWTSFVLTVGGVLAALTAVSAVQMRGLVLLARAARGAEVHVPDGHPRRLARLVRVLAAATLLVGGCASGRTDATPAASAVAWTRLGTQDAHSLAFVAGSTDRLRFGHHGGILETTDGGRSWKPLSVRADAMGMSAASDGSIFIAGHEVFMASSDDGETWRDVDARLPSLDIHAFARDPSDPARMWAYLAMGGVWESRDAGATWELVHQGHVPQLVAVDAGTGTELLGLDPFAGIIRSGDGGRTWAPVSEPPSAPVVSLTATPDGRIILLGAGDGLYRSDDAGATWAGPLLSGLPLATAVSSDGRVVAVVTRQTDFYRSEDGGQTWPGP